MNFIVLDESTEICHWWNEESASYEKVTFSSLKVAKRDKNIEAKQLATLRSIFSGR